MDFSHLLLGGVALSGIAATLIASFWSYFRLLASRASGLLVQRITLDGLAATAAYAYLRKHAKYAHPVSRKFGSRHAYDKVKKTMLFVAFEGASESPNMYWLGWIPLLLIPKASGGNKDAQSPAVGLRMNNDDFQLNITYIRGSLNLKTFLAQTMAWSGRDLDTMSRGFEVKTITGSRGEMGLQQSGSGPRIRTNQMRMELDELFSHDQKDVIFDVTSSPGVDDMSLSDNLLEAVEEARRWYKSRGWYNARNIPWRRGWQLLGGPGTGKTAFCRAVARDLNIPVFLLDLGSFTNRDLIRSWEEIREAGPCAVVMEDIDGVFHGRESVLPGGMTFDALLNCINGVNSPDGVFLMITTNKPELLDEALSIARPGRIDRSLHFGEPTPADLSKMALRILGRLDWPPREAMIKSFAQAQEYYTKKALEERWNPQPEPTPVETPDEQVIRDLVITAQEMGIKV